MSWRRLGATFLWLSLVAFLPVDRAHSANIDLKDYWTNTPGQWSRFTFSAPPDFPGFTVTLTVEGPGDYAGKFRLGDFITPDPGRYRWVIFDWDATHLYLYATPEGKIDPAAALPRILPLDTLLDNPLESDVAWYLTQLNSFTVPAGTFQNVLAWFNLDKDTKPNSVNAKYGLSGLPYGVTGVEWYGRTVGELQELSVDAQTGATQSLFVLQAYGLKSTGPPYLLLLQ